MIRQPVSRRTGEARAEHERSVQRAREIQTARSASAAIVGRFQADVVSIVTGLQHGESGLLTKNMITELRKALDLLESSLFERTSGAGTSAGAFLPARAAYTRASAELRAVADLLESLAGPAASADARQRPEGNTMTDAISPDPCCPGCGGKWPGTACVCIRCGWAPEEHVCAEDPCPIEPGPAGSVLHHLPPALATAVAGCPVCIGDCDRGCRAFTDPACTCPPW